MVTWKPNQQKYRATISGLLPEALQQRKSKKDSLNSVLEKWADSSDDEIKTISKLLNDGMKLAERGWLIGFATLITLGGTAAAIYFGVQPRIPRNSKCLIGEDCTAIAEDVFVGDRDYTGNAPEYQDWNNSKLTIRITEGTTGNDRLAIHHQGNNIEDICVMGNQVAYQGVVIARFTEGKGTQPLAITFKVEPPPETTNNATSTANVNNSPASDAESDRKTEDSRCITDGNRGEFPTDITPEIVQPVLNQIIYRNSQTSEVGIRTLEIKLNDGNSDSQPTYRTLALVEKNKPLKLEFPNSKIVKETRSLNIDGLKITKSDSSNNKDIQDMTVTLEVDHGKITINAQLLKKLTADNNKDNKDNKEKITPPIIQGNKTKKVTIKGTINQISSILRESNAITYQNDKDFLGNDVLKISIDDQRSVDQEEPDLVYPPKAKFRVGEGEIQIRVRPKNAPDLLNAPARLEVKEDAQLSISGLKIQDPNSKSIQVKFQVGNGKITIFGGSGGLNEAQVYGSETPNVILQGTVKQINNKLAAGIIYQGNEEFSGDDTLTVTVFDDEGYDDTKSINIKVNPVNDRPEIDSKSIVDGQPQHPTEPPSTQTNATVSGIPGIKNLRSGAGLEYGVVGNVRTGIRVQVIDSTRNRDNFLWYKVTVPQSGVQGWIASNLLTVDGQPQLQPQPQPQPPYQPPSQPQPQPQSQPRPKAPSTRTNATVSGTSGTKNLRSGPGTVYGVVGTAHTGDPVQILGSSYDQGGYQWYKVYHPKSGTTGWIAAQLINRD